MTDKPGIDNERIAEILATIGNLLEIQGENPFKVRAYRNAASEIEALPGPVVDLVEAGTLGEVRGIGKALVEKITELVREGNLRYYDDLREKVPPGVLEMLRIPGLGPKRVRSLWQELGVTTLHQLGEACSSGKVSGLKGFGKRAQKTILEGLSFLSKHEGMFTLGEALPLARGLLQHLSECGAEHSSVAGSIRRGVSVVETIDLVVSADHPEQILERFVKIAPVGDVLSHDGRSQAVLHNEGIRVNIRIAKHGRFSACLLWHTGSTAHRDRICDHARSVGLEWKEDGLYRDGSVLPLETEHDFFQELKLQYIPPELREDCGEVDAAMRGELPALVAASDIVGVLHCHSDWSDGRATVEEMAAKARSMGFRYLGMADHSKAAVYANGLDERRLREQMKKIDELNGQWNDFRILKGIECDILPDGRLDMDAGVLAELDYVVGSVHMRFKMGREEMTQRICNAICDKSLHVLGHPTGRLLLEREGYDVDMEKVIETAGAHAKVIELNASPKRLDIDWVQGRRAGERGVMIAINPDAHEAGEIENVAYGVITARRAWLGRDQVLNTRPWEEVRKILRGP